MFFPLVDLFNDWINHMYQTFPNILHAPEQMQQNTLKTLTFLSSAENCFFFWPTDVAN